MTPGDVRAWRGPSERGAVRVAAAPDEAPLRSAPAAPAEPEGLRALQMALLAEHDLLDLTDDAVLDAVARLATALSEYPVAMVNALQSTRTCQLARSGTGALEMDRDDSMCHRASLVGGVVVSGDCSTDPLFADLAWVDGRLGSVRRYAMAPLVADGTTIGTLCVLDEEPGAPLGEAQQRQLADLAAVASALVGRRRDLQQVTAAHADVARAHAELVRARAFERALLEALPVGVLALDTVEGTVLGNSTARAWHGYTSGADLRAAGARAFTVDVFEADGTTPLPHERTPLARVVAEGGVSSVEVVIRPAGQPARTVEVSGTAVRSEDGGAVLGAVVVGTDVTAQRALEAQLRRAATHDVLTGLPSRGLLVERLDRALAAGAAAGEAVAVLYCDLDDFKAVNDTCGHAAGDAVLREVAARLSAVLRPGDTAARLGGDEFVLVCPGVLDDTQAQALVTRVTAVTGRPVVVDGVEHRVGVSVGVVISSTGGTGGTAGTAEGMLSCADAAMYAAKRRRREQRAERALSGS